MTPRRAARAATRLILAALVVAAAIVWYAVANDSPAAPDAENVNVPSATNAAAPQTAGTNAPNANAATNASAEPTATFEDADAGVTFSHPASWKVVKDVTGSGDEAITSYAIGTGQDGVALSIAPLSLEGIIRDSFSVHETTAVTINGRPAERAVGASAKDGGRVDLLLFRTSARVYVLDGPAEHVDAIGATLRITE